MSSRYHFRTIRFLAGAAAIFVLGLTAFTQAADAQSADAGTIRVMILTGQSSIYHDWKKSSRVLEAILEEPGIFTVDVVTTPAQGESMAGFTPRWSDYDVVVMDYDGDEWSEATQASFVDYLSSGGGLVLVHAADNAFPDWPEFQLMAGLTGWRGRDESVGPMLRWRDGGPALDTGPGTAQHPAQHDFQITVRASDHPITHGLPLVWMQAHDEMYSQLRGPARNVTILATARADASMRGATGEHEPMLMTISYGDGRVFHTTLGHVSPNDELPVATMSSVGFIVTVQRGAEWAATGQVTQAVPGDFPEAERPSVRNWPAGTR